MTQHQIKILDIPIGDLPPSVQNLLEGMFPGSTKFVSGEAHEADPKIATLRKMMEDDTIGIENALDALQSFGFHMPTEGDDPGDTEMWGYSAEMGDKIADYYMEQDEKHRHCIHVDDLATMAWLVGLAQGMALGRGCDGANCANCGHHQA